MRFTKMHGAGNDYVYVNGFTEQAEDWAALAVAVSQPHFGIGSDGLIVVLPSEVADFRMLMFNNDGSEGVMCGNGARCVGRFVHEYGLTDKTHFTLETGGGIREIWLQLDANGKASTVRVDMGMPQAVELREGCTYVSMGNPHLVYVVQENPFDWEDFRAKGEPLCLAENANIEFVQVLSGDYVRMRVWERGSGETLACGSGACATAVAVAKAGLCGNDMTVEMRGGCVQITLEADGRVLMTGPANVVFEGEWMPS